MAAAMAQRSTDSKGMRNKRKRPSTDQGHEHLSQDQREAQRRPEKRREINGEDVDESIGHMDAGLLAGYVAKKVRRFGRRQDSRQTSGVEHEEDRYLPQRIFYDTSNFGRLRSLDNLPLYLEQFCDNKAGLSTSDPDAGNPHTLIVASSGLRAADLTRLESLVTEPFWGQRG